MYESELTRMCNVLSVSLKYFSKASQYAVEVIKSGLNPSQNIHMDFVVFSKRIDINIEAYSLPPLEKRDGLFSLTNFVK